MKNKIITLVIIIISLVFLFSFNNKTKYLSIITSKTLMEGNDYIFDSEDVNFSDDSMSSKNVKDAVDELKQAINDGCKPGYTKGSITDTSYVCTKRTASNNQGSAYESEYVKYNKNNSGLASNNVKNAILELALLVPNCKQYYHKANETSSSYSCLVDTRTATFYYQSNTTSGSTTVTSTSETCNATSNGTCTITIPSAVRSSGGTYNNAYYGLSNSTGNMTAAIAKGTITITLSQDKSYYALYSSQVTVHYPTSTTAKSSTNAVYRNQWLSSTTAMATTVLATTATGTSSNYSFTSSVTGYSFYGFATSAGTSTRTYNTVAALKTSNATTVYAILYKSVEATFYYSNSGAGAKTSTTASANQYIRCTSSAAEINNNTISPSLTGETAPNGTAILGWSTSLNSVSTKTADTTNTTYYRVYRSALTVYYPTSASALTSKNNVLYRIGVLNESSDTSFTRKVVNGTSSVTQLTNSNITSSVLAGMYGTFTGLATAVNTTTKYDINNATITSPSANTTTYYAVVTKAESYTITYNSNAANGGFTKATDTSSTVTSTYYCASTSSVAVSHGTTTCSPSTTVQNSVGTYNSAYKGLSSSSTGITTVTNCTGGTTYYAYYQKSITNYYYNGTSHTSRTIYRNEYFNSTTTMLARLSTSATGTSDYSTAAGPGSSTWSGLSTAADATAEFSSVAAAATSTTAYTNLYTVYNLSITFNKNNAASQDGNTAATISKSCKFYTGTTCNITTPVIVGTMNTPVIIGYSDSANNHTVVFNHNTSISFDATETPTYFAQTASNPTPINIQFLVNGNNGTDTTETCTPYVVYNNATPETTCEITSPPISPHENTPTILGWSTGATNHTNSWTPETTETVSASGTYYAQTYVAQKSYTQVYNIGGASMIFDELDNNQINELTSPYTRTCYADAEWNGDEQASSCQNEAPMISWPDCDEPKWANASTNANVTAKYNPGESIEVNAANNGRNLYALCYYTCNTGQTINLMQNSSNDGLYQDTTTEIRYIYRGDNSVVNNYINFALPTANHPYRIISIEPERGRMKITYRAGQEKSFDYSSGTTGNRVLANSYCAATYGCNAWKKTPPDGSSGYYNQIKDVSNAYKEMNVTYLGNLQTNSADLTGMISNAVWNVGSIHLSNDASKTADQILSLEQQTTETSTIGLPSISDYMKASTSSTCLTLSNAHRDNKKCKTDNWLNTGYVYWTTTASNANHYQEFYIDENGIGVDYVSHTKRLYPTFYVDITYPIRGTGTESDPFIFTDANMCSMSTLTNFNCTISANSGYDITQTLTINTSATGVEYSFDGTNFSSTNTRTVSAAGNYYGYIRDSATGLINSCSIVIKSRNEYQHNSCTSCDSCYYCESGIKYIANSTAFCCIGSIPAGTTRYECEVEEGGNWCSGLNKCGRTMTTATVGSNCDKCGCNTWDTSDTTWYTRSCGNGGTCSDRNTRITYGT